MNGARARPPAPAGADAGRAERYEDEKRRIIHSCFSNVDADGAVSESYITHIRIIEDAAYPSAPAPPTSPPANKKPRVIVVAVRRSGQLRMYKARENADGSFSIGKKWLFHDLSRIQVFDHLPAASQTESMLAQWAGSVGFVVTITKPYYWQAMTSKERDFFISSLAKVYRKYTGGRMPELVGFTPQEREAIAGPIPASAQPAAAPAAAPATAPPPAPLSPVTRPPPNREHRELRELRELRDRDRGQRELSSKASQDRMRPPPTDTRAMTPTGRTTPTPMPSTPTLQEPPAPWAGSPSRPSTAGSTSSLPSSVHDRVEQRTRPAPLSPRTRPSQEKVIAPSPSVPPTSVPPSSIPPAAAPARPVPPGLHPGFNTQMAAADSPVAAPQQSRELQPPPTHPSAVPPVLRSVPSKEQFASPPKAESSPPPSVDGLPASSPSPPASDMSSLAKALSADPEPEPPAEPPTSPPEEEHRPGLGPMFKKKNRADLAAHIKKAANVYSAFTPRAGGAGARLMAQQEKQEKEGSEKGADGVTGVFHAPSPVQPPTPSVEAPKPIKEKEITAPTPSPAIEISTSGQPEEPLGPTVDDTKAIAQAERHRAQREDEVVQCCAFLGLSPDLLQGRGVEFDDILVGIGWEGHIDSDKRLQDLEAQVRREIGRVQANSWLGHLEVHEGKMDQLGQLFDRTISECDQLDGLLTLYSHELNTLADDVAFLETQGQGLQVQTANQKQLQNELHHLLATISLSPLDLRPLHDAPLNAPAGLEEAETALVLLYKAMVTIDPDIRPIWRHLPNTPGGSASAAAAAAGVYADTEVGQMRAVKERKGDYRYEAQQFLQRLAQYIDLSFKTAQQKAREAVAAAAPAASSGNASKAAPGVRDEARQGLWMYSPLMLFAREASSTDWLGFISSYQILIKPSFQAELGNVFGDWKRVARKPLGDDSELLFTHAQHEKEAAGGMGGMGNPARKLTVRRGKTVRHNHHHNNMAVQTLSGERVARKIDQHEAFAGALDDTAGIVAEEQNFVVRFFHLSSLSPVEFPDLIAAVPPYGRRLPDLRAALRYDPDRELAHRVEQAMDVVFSFWATEVQGLAEWAINLDPIQTIGVLLALERKIVAFEGSNQEFLIHTLQKLHLRLLSSLSKFIDEQIRAIEETKVKIKKRKGVISFMKTFPLFAGAIEQILVSVPYSFEVRVAVDDAYSKILRAMWESLKFIAKEAPGQAVPAAAGPSGATTGANVGDFEEKEILNYHILLIENMTHYLDEVIVDDTPPSGPTSAPSTGHFPPNAVLSDWRARAASDRAEHLRLYVDAVVRRPLGKLLEFLDGAERVARDRGSDSGGMATLPPSHSRHVAKKVLAMYEHKELKRGVEALKKRVEKHFGGEMEEGAGGVPGAVTSGNAGAGEGLIGLVLSECERKYVEAFKRLAKIRTELYEGTVEMPWSAEDAVAQFRR